MPPFERHLFICNNERKEGDPRGSCVARGANEMLDIAKDWVHQNGLKGKVRVNKAGCLDACKHGPAMVVYPDDVWYSPQNKEEVETILQEHIKDGKAVEHLALTFSPKKI